MTYVAVLAVAIIAAFAFYGDWVRLGSPLLQAAAAVSGVVFLAGFHARVSTWARAAATDTGGDSLLRILTSAMVKFFSPDCLFAARLFREHRVRGAVLAVTIWSFMALFAGTLLLSSEYTFGLDLTSSRLFSLVMDLAGGALFLAILFYIIRRMADREARAIAVMGDHLVLWAFLLIILTGFALEGARIAYYRDADAGWSPLGLLASEAVGRLAAREDIPRIKGVLYNLHALLVFAFIAYVPFSKQFHMFSAQVVTAGARERARLRKRLMHE